MRGALASALTAALLLTLALTASGAEPELRPRASALILGGAGAPRGQVAVRGTDVQRKRGRIEAPGVEIADGASSARASVDAGTARGAAVARSVTLLDGRVTAYGVRRTAEATPDGVTYDGRVQGLVVDGRTIGEVTDPAAFDLADGAGRVVVNRGRTGLRLVLTAAAGALPAGSDVRIAVAGADVREVAPTPTATPTPTPTATATPQRTPEAGEEKAARPRKRHLERRSAPKVAKRLTRAGFAFPVYGDADFSDTFGAARAAPIVAHQGVDVFAPFGSPVVAVTDGTVSKVGTLEISGNRLWLTTDSGDAFFYAHLSAFAPAAVDGRHVKAGTVLGFVGNTGDAEPTPPHVHFEVHPGGMDEDAIDPYRILLAWQGRRDVPADAWLKQFGPDTTERPGALVTVRDFIAE